MLYKWNRCLMAAGIAEIGKKINIGSPPKLDFGGKRSFNGHSRYVYCKYINSLVGQTRYTASKYYELIKHL